MLALAAPLLPGPRSPNAPPNSEATSASAPMRKLVAMAGERLRLPGFVEISAVCTAPAWRGRGYASALVAQLGHAILQRGKIPFLHVHGENRQAIAVYRRLGFTLRRVMHLVVLRAIAA